MNDNKDNKDNVQNATCVLLPDAEAQPTHVAEAELSMLSMLS